MRLGHYLRPAAGQHLIVFLAFCLVYLATLQYCRTIAFRDPSSLFFQIDRGFDRLYSSVRQGQADEFIDRSPFAPSGGRASSDPSLCVGMTTVQRAGARYFKTAVGSLLQGLGEHERSRMYLIAMIAQSEPTEHVAFNEPWPQLLLDELLTYDNLSSADSSELKYLEATDHKYDKKSWLDYSHLLSRCMQTGAPYILMLEDDVLALDGWYHRADEAIRQLEQQHNVDDSLYIRLFYTDKFLGWNSEQWPKYLLWSLMVEVSIAATLVGIRRSRYASMLDRRTLMLCLILYCPAFVALYFATGRLTVAGPPTGLHRMDSYGCCSQALLFPRDRVPGLISYFHESEKGKVDSLTEKYANEHGLARWALTPVLFQHVGTQSASRKDGSGLNKWGLAPALSIWNFKFELNDVDRLSAERERYQDEWPHR